jgi:hypothetical protein
VIPPSWAPLAYLKSCHNTLKAFYVHLSQHSVVPAQLEKVRHAISHTVGGADGSSVLAVVDGLFSFPQLASSLKLEAIGSSATTGEIMEVITADKVAAASVANDELTDVFLTHDWGIDSQGRANHARVSKINKGLKRRGISTWFDEEKMEGSIIDKMCAGIDNAAVIVVFVTERYCAKVNGSNRQDNCKLEFAYAAQRKGAAKMVACVMEEGVRNPGTWAGMLGMVLGGDLYVDAVEDGPKLDAALDQLAGTVRSLMSKVAGGACAELQGGKEHPRSTPITSLAAVPASVPRLPAGYVVRDSTLVQILTILLTDTASTGSDGEDGGGNESDGAMIKTADSKFEDVSRSISMLPPTSNVIECTIHGMGGSGKTVVASAVCRNPRVRARYDCICFYVASQTSSSINALGSIYFQLTGTAFSLASD